MRFLETHLLQSAAPKVKTISGAEIFRDIFIQKDAEEIAATRKAVEIAQEALLQTLPHVQPGKSEHEIANLLVINLLKAGSEPELAFSPIIASGPNAANPHANPGSREMQAGDMLIIDSYRQEQAPVSVPVTEDYEAAIRQIAAVMRRMMRVPRKRHAADAAD
jgi:Xaa-Pro dipeptidase